MKLTDFYDKVEADESLEGVGVESPESEHAGVIVRHLISGLTTRLPIEAVCKADWGLIAQVLKGEREPVALQHMTRVVGYYSRVENWNKSKIGELKDRQKGEYALAEPAMA